MKEKSAGRIAFRAGLAASTIGAASTPALAQLSFNTYQFDSSWITAAAGIAATT